MSFSKDKEKATGHSRSESATESTGTRKKDKDTADPDATSNTDAGPQRQRTSSPVPSCVSMKSDKSMVQPIKFSSQPTPSDLKPQRQRTSSPVPSCVSMKSDKSMVQPIKFSSQPTPSDLKPQRQRTSSPVPSCVSMKSDKSMVQPIKFSSQPTPSDLNAMCHHTEHTSATRKTQDDEVLRRVKEIHKASLKRRFEKISEGIIKPGAETLLSDTYTMLYITEGDSEGVNMEHEVWQIESAITTQNTEDAPINCKDIFRSLPGQNRFIRTVMTKGVAGIGKTVSVQKFILDWTDGLSNDNVDFMFPLSFRELNMVTHNQYSLHKLLLDFHPELKELNSHEEYKDCQVVFIFDGLDESRLTLNFEQNINVYDVKETSSVDVLITSLIQYTLFPSAHIWITSRPAAASQIPTKYINRLTEIRGFSDLQKKEYFRKRINDESLANRIIKHIMESRSLHIMCHIPVFCSIAASVLQQMLEQGNIQEIPQTLTEMFIHFLLIQTTVKNQKYQTGLWTNNEELLESQRDHILKLAELAFVSLEDRKLIFYEKDLRECGIDVREVSVYSGICTEIFKEESMFHQGKVYCFVHLSIQEFLAALHIFVSYSNQMETIKTFFSLVKSLKFTVMRVLESRNGHLDLFFRFLMGICLERNQKILKGVLKRTHSNSENIKEICQYIKDLNRKDLSPERYISLLQCLSEVNDNSIHEEIQQYHKSPEGFKIELSLAHCSALAHRLLMSEEVLDEFDLKEYNTSDEGRRRLIPAVRRCRKAILGGCKLNRMSFETVKRTLQHANSLTHLDLSHNPLGDSGVQILSSGLASPHCQLQILRLAGCELRDKSCEILARVLQSLNSMTELDLSTNDLGDSGVELLSKGLSSPHCELQILRLSGCLISEKGSGFLSSALTSNPSHIKELDLSYNHPGESGLKLLSAREENPHCSLKILNTYHCAEIRLRPGVQKYPCKLTLDPNTAQRNLSLSKGNRKVTFVRDELPYPDHPERFDRWPQVFCEEGLSGRCYWEAEWSGGSAQVIMSYKRIAWKGGNDDGRFGYNAKSWTLYCSPQSYSAWHNKQCIKIPAPSSGSRRVGVYLDWQVGTLSFYSVSSDTLTHLHTFHSTFTEPLYPACWLWEINSSVSLCQITCAPRSAGTPDLHTPLHVHE